MQNIEEIIEESQRLIFNKTGKSISFIQKVILRDSLNVSQKTYAQIAVENNYSENYIKQLVAPKLWQQLSKVIGEKVNRTNCRAVLEQYLNSYYLKLQSTTTGGKVILESPEMPVPPASPFYIERGLEKICYQEVNQSRPFICIKAPQKMGKTSLLNRIIAHANFQKYSIVSLNLYLAETELFTSVNKFLRWFCANINHQLGLESKISDFWDDDIGALMNSTIYFQEYILKQISSPIILVLDEVNHLFEYPNLARDFLALLRSWYEETRDISIWQKLRIVLVTSTDVYINLETNRSPFNIGTSIELPAFTKLQVQDLGLRHHLELTPAQLEQLMELTGGFPYLGSNRSHSNSNNNPKTKA
ncbi:MAG: AAA-like domain-containing protein [Scytonematopsis contorta HA4267-MV1]|jgi:Cdc6-like AAA superfamily ATPase|nr:AAA-like domain-containing protein [Scytonematopsis contorta HA4267-MV1]